MEIIQFEDKNLSHFSYAIISEKSMALVDPSRNVQAYKNLALERGLEIEHVIETHPHADFVSSHLELHRSEGAQIHCSKLLGAEYPHKSFDSGDRIRLGAIELAAINTPGHSPDSISIVAYDEQGEPQAVFTGDTLFIGDCGRPDLRETAGAITAMRQDLAKHMYRSLREGFANLPDHVKVYPAHGAGSLCGKGLSAESSSTLGEERLSNWSLQNQTEDEFVTALLSDQPFIPKYFVHDVALNKKGAPDLGASLARVHRGVGTEGALGLLVDTRSRETFRAGHRPGALHLMDDLRFETWLGSIVHPGEAFSLVVKSAEKGEELIERVSRIGYEAQLAAVLVKNSVESGDTQAEEFNPEGLFPGEYVVCDVRNASEAAALPIFENAINIPLHQLRERASELPEGKPILVHCAAGYRSAAGSSILRSAHPRRRVHDLSTAVKEYAQVAK